MFRPINAIFGSKNQQKIHPEKIVSKEKSKPVNMDNTRSYIIDALSLNGNKTSQNVTIRTNTSDDTSISTYMPNISTIVNIENNDPCNAIYIRYKDPSAYEELKKSNIK